MKILYIVRGVSGAGKSTFANTLGVPAFSADMFFEDGDGNYNFDASKLKAAHNWCKNAVYNVMSEGVSVAVANTFTREWEMKDYYDFAEEFGYTVFSVIVENRHGGTNIHNVPAETIDAMKERFEVVL